MVLLLMKIEVGSLGIPGLPTFVIQKIIYFFTLNTLSPFLMI